MVDFPATGSTTSQSFIPPRPGDIDLQYIKIINFDQSETQNITLLVREVNVYESMHSNHIRVDLVIEDALSLVTRMPIIGEEVVLMKFRTPSVAPESFEYDWVDLALRVVKLDKMAPTNIRDAIYRIECVTYPQLMSVGSLCSQSYGPMTISDMVKKIANDWLELDAAKLTVEDTEGDHVFTIPGLRPFGAINFLANEAKSKQYAASDFLFFETHKGHHFVTVSSLIDKPAKEQYFFFEQSRSSAQLPTQSLGQNSGDLTAIGRKNPSDFRTMINLSYEKIFDVEQQIADGMYDNTIMMIDPLLQQFDTVTVGGHPHFNYESTFNDFKHLAKGRAGQTTQTVTASPLTVPDGQLAKIKGTSHIRYIITDKNQPADFKVWPRKRQDFLPWLVSARQQNRAIVCELVVPGDSDRVPGDVIYFELHEMGGTDDVVGELNKYLSGAYLVTSLRHKYTHGATMPFVTVLECTKNCYESKIANAKVAVGTQTFPTDNDALAKAKEIMKHIPK